MRIMCRVVRPTIVRSSSEQVIDGLLHLTYNQRKFS